MKEFAKCVGECSAIYFAHIQDYIFFISFASFWKNNICGKNCAHPEVLKMMFTLFLTPQVLRLQFLKVEGLNFKNIFLGSGDLASFFKFGLKSVSCHNKISRDSN